MVSTPRPSRSIWYLAAYQIADAARGVRASESGVEAARPQLARHRFATSFLDDQDERIDVSQMLDMAAMRAVMRRFGKEALPALSVQRRLDLAPPRSKRCVATLALACLAGWLGSMSGECSKSPGG
jgi:hypothetical protein